ncbi:MAG: nuclear transport factor 2 family protein [Candidatus Acidiferrales bacterium]
MIRRWILLSLCAVGFFGLGMWTMKNAAAAEDLKVEVLKAEAARNEALPKSDVPALEKIYADDLAYINAKGETLTKQQHLAEVKARTLHFVSFQHNDVQVHMVGDTGIVTGISTSAVSYDGKVSTHPRRFMNVYVKTDGRWLCAAHMETPITK